ncbi:MAG: HEAT repeat domain-containing protein [Abitibacteriaceae bacterium]|nr:HEAT repeat domain-containing protein [Abditibacteriaceae bacterium]
MMQTHKHPRLLGLAALGIVTTAPILLPQLAHAQPPDAATLISELKGETAAQTRTADQEQTAYTQALDALLPAISSDDLNVRGPAEDNWEKIALRAARPGAEADRLAASKAMLSRLGTNTSQEGRLWILKQLENIGRGEAVPTLVGLLNDPNPLVKERARRALSNNPSTEASQALRTALTGADTPEWRIAIINALGYRRDTVSIPAIAKFAQDTDARVAATAVAELSAIGGPDAVRDLQAAKGTATGPLRKNVIDALLLSADRMVHTGNAAPAAAIYQSLYVPTEARGVQIAALRGLVVARGQNSIPVLTTVLSGNDDQMRMIASRLISEVPGTAATQAFAALVPKLPAAGQAALIDELGNRGDVAARAAIVNATRSTDNNVRLAALRALGRLGNATDIALLANAASGTQGADSDAARASLASLHGADINNTLLTGLNNAPAKTRVELIRALSARHDTDQPAITSLVRLLQDADPAVRTASVNALGVLGNAQVLPSLVSLETKATTTDDQRDALTNALSAIINNMPDKSAGATPVLAALNGANPDARRTLLTLLKYTGGTAALDAVRAATKDTNADVQDTAVRTLADWPDPVATTDLLQIARTDPKETHQVLAMRGYVRLAGLGDRPARERVRLFQEALDVARRPEEKRLALAGLADVNDPAAFQAVAAYLNNKDLAEEAATAAVKIGNNIGGTAGPSLKPVMRQIIAVSKNQDTIKGANDVLNLADVVLRGWQILGPLPAENQAAAFDKNYGPETAVDLTKTYPGAGGKTVGWKPAVIQPNGLVALEKQLDPHENVVGYATVYVKSPDARKAIVSVGSDDGIKVWINGKQVIANNANRPAAPGTDQANVDLNAGWNQVLLKITQGGGEWGYYFDLLDAQKKPMTDITYAASPQG